MPHLTMNSSREIAPSRSLSKASIMARRSRSPTVSPSSRDARRSFSTVIWQHYACRVPADSSASGGHTYRSPDYCHYYYNYYFYIISIIIIIIIMIRQPISQARSCAVIKKCEKTEHRSPKNEPTLTALVVLVHFYDQGSDRPKRHFERHQPTPLRLFVPSGYS